MSSQTLFIESKNDKTLIQVYLSCSLTKEQQNEAPGIIIAHPYGPLGGNMNNNVVIAIQRHFLSKGYVTACINFRGCGKSKGRTSWTAMPERDDYTSVMDYLLDGQEYQKLNYPKINQLVLCGYSFGAMIANSIECTKVPCAYLLVSIPLGVIWALATTKASFFKKQQAKNKVLCIYGDRDQFTRHSTFSNWCCLDHIDDVCIQGADHFWMNDEQELIENIEKWRSLKLSFSHDHL